MRVHATKSHVPICELPQALDFSLDSEGLVLVTAVSGKSDLLLCRANPLVLIRKWLPAVWSKATVSGQAPSEQGQGRKWTLNPISQFSVLLSITGFSPNLEFAAIEIESALLATCSPLISRALEGTAFIEHEIRTSPNSIRRINNRIHDIAQEVEEIEL